VNFLSQLLRGIAFIPSLVNGIEALFHSKSGAEKKDAAMTFLENALATVDAVTARDVQELAGELLGGENLGLCVIGPIDESSIAWSPYAA